MRRHAEIGAETLRSVMGDNANQPFLRMSLDIAWCHHEKWDGSGYPRGLAGDAIPLAARIVALCDVYDALTSARTYKAAWTHDAALLWILQGSGSHFDPRVVDAFVRRAAQAEAIKLRLADTDADRMRLASTAYVARL
jgi:putative two-component system response regulator